MASARLHILAGALFLTRCSCHPQPERSSSGSDVGLEVAVPADASSDAVFDGAVETSSPVDAGFFPGEWGPIPGAEECGNVLAKSPSVSAQPFAWESCGDGCRWLLVNWPVDRFNNVIRINEPEPMRRVSDGGQLVVRRTNGYPLKREVVSVQPLDGQAIAAVRNDDIDATPACSLRIASGDMGIAVAGFTVTTPRKRFVAVQRAGKPMAARWLPAEALPTSTTYLQGLSVGGDHLFVEVRSPESIVAFDASLNLEPVVTSAEFPLAIGTEAFAVRVLDATILRVVPSGTPTNVARPSAGSLLTYVAVDRASAVPTLYWAEQPTGDVSKVSIMRSVSGAATRVFGYADAADFTRGGGQFVANAGWVLTQDGKKSAIAYEVATGRALRVAPPTNRTFIQPLFIDPLEATLLVAQDDLPPGDNASATGIVRLRLDGLPARTFP